MKINLNSVMVDDQEKALTFYTEVLGLAKKQDFPVGEYRWITVVSPEDPDGPQLALEPNAHPASQTFQKAMYDDGLPLISFEVDDIHAEIERLKKLDVVIRTEPMDAGSAWIAQLEDPCGNIVMLYTENTD